MGDSAGNKQANGSNGSRTDEMQKDGENVKRRMENQLKKRHYECAEQQQVGKITQANQNSQSAENGLFWPGRSGRQDWGSAGWGSECTKRV